MMLKKSKISLIALSVIPLFANAQVEGFKPVPLDSSSVPAIEGQPPSLSEPAPLTQENSSQAAFNPSTEVALKKGEDAKSEVAGMLAAVGATIANCNAPSSTLTAFSKSRDEMIAKEPLTFRDFTRKSVEMGFSTGIRVREEGKQYVCPSTIAYIDNLSTLATQLSRVQLYLDNCSGDKKEALASDLSSYLLLRHFADMDISVLNTEVSSDLARFCSDSNRSVLVRGLNNSYVAVSLDLFQSYLTPNALKSQTIK